MINLWKTEYLLNLDLIDDQHKKFFSMCSDVVALADVVKCDKHSITKVIKALGAMRTYAFLHFKTEEDIMLKFGFPGYLKHTVYHNGYLQRMVEFEISFKTMLTAIGKGEKDNDKLKSFLLKLSEFIAQWWSEHILTQDSAYAEHIKDKKPGDLWS